MLSTPFFLWDCNETWSFPRDFSENRPTEVSYFMQNRPVGAEMFYSGEETDKYDESNSRFSQFSDPSKKKKQ